MKKEEQFPSRENFVVEEAVEHLLKKVDLSTEFCREGFIAELRRERQSPCPFWIREFNKRCDTYAIPLIESAYQRACSELIEYFSEV